MAQKKQRTQQPRRHLQANPLEFRKILNQPSGESCQILLSQTRPDRNGSSHRNLIKVINNLILSLHLIINQILSIWNGILQFPSMINSFVAKTIENEEGMINGKDV